MKLRDLLSSNRELARRSLELEGTTVVVSSLISLMKDQASGLREHGFTDEDAWDIAGITALFGLSNRMANVTSMRPNDEFYMLGRVPRAPKTAT